MPEMKEVKFEIDVTPDDSGVFYSAHELPSRSGGLEIGPNALDSLGASPGQTGFLSWRPAVELVVLVRLGNHRGTDIWHCRKCKIAFCSTAKPKSCINGCQAKFHPTLTIELADLLVGKVTEVEA